MNPRAICAIACGVALAVAADVSSASAASSANPPCTTAGLVVWLNTAGDAAAGSTYFKLEFTNQSGRACTLRGYPGVSGVDLRGHSLGSAGSRNPSAIHVVNVASGGTATAVLRITVAGNFPESACHRVAAAGLRVYPPNQTASKIVPFPFEACSRSGPAYVSVKAVA